MMSDDLDRHLKTTDPDRWLATRFIADADRRADVMALYAFDRELARASVVTSQPMLGEIRLAWWREAVEEAFAGAPPRAHPVVEALSAAIGRRGLDAKLFETLIEARHRDLEPEPLSDEATAYAEATEGSVMALAGRVLDSAAEPAAFRAAGRAWGLARLARAGRLTPDMAARAPELVRDALNSTPRLTADAFPVVAYAIFAKDYAAGRDPAEGLQRLRLIWAVARGRL
jgi:phytoene synthase